MRTKTFFLFLLLFSAFVLPASYAWEGRVVKIADGDTITVLAPGNRQVKVRLYGVDCPESKQAFGQRARQFTASLVGNKTVDVQEMDTDRYSRVVGVVTVPGGKILNKALIEAGLAWVYTYYCKADFCPAWKREEILARQERRGLWRDGNPVPPWEWRREKRKAREKR